MFAINCINYSINNITILIADETDLTFRLTLALEDMRTEFSQRNEWQLF